MAVKQIPLLGPNGIRAQGDVAGSDFRFYLNGYFEDAKGIEEARKYPYVKRPGLAGIYFTLNSAFNNYKIQGVGMSADRIFQVMFTNNGSTFRVCNYFNGVFSDNGVPAGSWTATGAAVFTTLDGISYGGGNSFAATDFTEAALVTSTGVWNRITDSVFTGLTKTTNFIALDGYLFIGTTNNRIYNSALNDPTTWNALNFLTALDIPGRLLWLGRIRNYLIAFKDKSIEFFEDIGNPVPGSPLEPRKQLNRSIGCLNKNSIQEVSDGIIFAGTCNKAGIKIYKIVRDTLQIIDISDRYIEQILPMLPVETTQTSYSVDSVASTTFRGQSQVFTIGGKEFYTINIPDVNSSSAKYTQVYDNQLQLWTSWSSSINTTQVKDTYGFAVSQSQTALTNGVTHPIFVDNSVSGASAAPRFLYIDPTNLLYYDKKADSSQNIYTFGWVSDIFDFGTQKRKFADMLEILYDIDSSVAPGFTGNTLTVGYKDWGFNATSGYNVNKTIKVDIGHGLRARSFQLGSFYRRSFSITYNATTALRIWAMELWTEQGETDMNRYGQPY